VSSLAKNTTKKTKRRSWTGDVEIPFFFSRRRRAVLLFVFTFPSAINLGILLITVDREW